MTAACDNKEKTPGNGKTGGVVYKSAEELNPGRLPYDEGLLIYGGTPMPVKLQQKKGENNETVLSLVSRDGTELEQERYVSDKSGFRYAGGIEESFDPPVPLIKSYPFDSKSSWQWGGEMIYAGRTFAATAEVKTDSEQLNLSTGSYPAVVVTVEVHMEGANPTQPYTLRFWIVPGEGVMRRDFGASATREPTPKTQE